MIKTDPRIFWSFIALIFILLIIGKVYTTQPVLTLQDSIEQLHSQITDSSAHDTIPAMPVIRGAHLTNHIDPKYFKDADRKN